MFIPWWVIALMALSSCATVSTQEFRNGTQVVYVTHCNGHSDPGACYTQANLKCPGGWDLLGSQHHVVPQLVSQPSGNPVLINHQKQSLTYKCKKGS